MGEYVYHLNHDLHVDACNTATLQTIQYHLKMFGDIAETLKQEYGISSRRQFYELVHYKLDTICNLLDNDIKVVLLGKMAKHKMASLLLCLLLSLVS